MEPTVEIYTTDNDVTVAADLPGFEEHEIRLLFINGTLTIIAGENQEPRSICRRWIRTRWRQDTGTAF